MVTPNYIRLLGGRASWIEPWSINAGYIYGSIDMTMWQPVQTYSIQPLTLRTLHDGGLSFVLDTHVVEMLEIGIEDTPDDQPGEHEGVDITGPSQVTQISQPPLIHEDFVPKHSTLTKRGPT